MKCSLKKVGAIILCILFPICFTSCGGIVGGLGGDSIFQPAFTTSDLSGTWYLFGASSGGLNEGTMRGTVTLNSSGHITGGSYTHSDGTVATFTDGILTIDGEAVLSGNATTNIGVNITITSGKMNASKNMLSFGDSTNIGDHYFVTAIKAGETFAPSDLSGTWHLFGASSGGTGEGTICGTVTLNSSGQIAGGSYTHAYGTVATLTGGALTIDGAGVLSGNATTNIGVNITITSGKMNASKNMLSFVDSTNIGELYFVTAIKAGETFAPLDLSGTWHLFGVSSGGVHKGTIRGTVTMNSSGQITGGTYIHSGGTVATLTGSTLTIDDAGVLSGNATTNVGVNITITSGKMNASKNMLSFVDSTNFRELDLIVAIKGY